MRCLVWRVVIFLLFGLFAPVSAQSITVTGPVGTLYCGFSYNISWTSTALASSTALTIELWNQNTFGPDTKVLTVTANALNTGSYVWTIPTNNNNVLGTNEMYFLIYVTGGSTTAQGASNSITRATINSVQTPGGGSASIGSPVSLGYTYTAPSTATVTITLARNTNPITTIGTIIGPGSPITLNTFTWTPSAQLMPSSDYYLIVSIDQDSNARAASSVFTLFGATITSSSTSVTSSTTAATTGSTTTTGGGSGQVQWGGRYTVQAGCNTMTCCCLTGDVFITQSGLNVAFNGSLTGNCAGATTLTASVNLPSLSSSTTTFMLFGQTFTAVRSGSQIVVTNGNDPQCSGSAVCVSGDCLVSSNTVSSSSSTSSDAVRESTIFLAFVFAIVAVMTV